MMPLHYMRLCQRLRRRGFPQGCFGPLSGACFGARGLFGVCSASVLRLFGVCSASVLRLFGAAHTVSNSSMRLTTPRQLACRQAAEQL